MDADPGGSVRSGDFGGGFGLRQAEIGKGADDSHGFQAGGDYLADEALYILLIVGPIGIVDDAAALIG